MNPNREPVTIAGVVAALLTLVGVFGITVTDDQVQALVVVATALAPVVTNLVARRFTSPVNDTVSLDFYLDEVAKLNAQITALKKRKRTTVKAPATPAS